MAKDITKTVHNTITLHDALPIWRNPGRPPGLERGAPSRNAARAGKPPLPKNPRPENSVPPGGAYASARAFRYHIDRKSTRLNSSHVKISYAVFCLKKKR